MFDRLFRLFRSPPRPVLVYDGYGQLGEQEEARRAARRKQIQYLHELGGFDTFFENDDQNWARQAELLVEFKRRLDAIEAKLEKL